MLKVLAVQLTHLLALLFSKRCYHVKNHGGVKGAIRDIQDKLADYQFVFKKDVKDYYASIDHSILHEQLAERIKDKGILRLLWQMMRRVETWGGLFWTPQRGIPRGCSLSPLMGAIYLSDLDHAFEQKTMADKVQYFRFQDDILVLAKTRWHLRQAIKIIKQHFSKLKVAEHPDKTFVGRTTREFDFLGYHFDAQKIIGIAQASLDRFIANMY